ncbi:MAG: hypothetical protein LBT83_06260 [Tannerella sp.]|nr:hypothetical protein [Tannerella sp.]
MSSMQTGNPQESALKHGSRQLGRMLPEHFGEEVRTPLNRSLVKHGMRPLV